MKKNEIENNIRKLAKNEFEDIQIENFIQVFKSTLNNMEHQIVDYFLQISTDHGNELELGFINASQITDVTLSNGKVYTCTYSTDSIKTTEIKDNISKWTLIILGEKNFDYNVVKPKSTDQLIKYQNSIQKIIDQKLKLNSIFNKSI